MKKSFIVLILIIGFLRVNAQYSEPDFIKTSKGNILIQPVLHSSLIIKWNQKTIYVDPYKELEIYKEYPNPSLILITDIHGDHLNIKTLETLVENKTTILAPIAVKEKLPDNLKLKTMVLNNGEIKNLMGISIEAIPMYNLPENDQSRHLKGRGNGYVLKIDNKKIYIAGDTADIPEMRNLKKIDIAFICMNLPYTMDFETAADAVLDFKPAIVYPYHFRGKDGFSDVEAFKALVFEKNPDIEVRLRIWYPEN
ncbi:MAG TPA: MBL fold metallo-hydrolase [Flavobacteriaceae bacterium]|nr:MBL fold metallo-hydrolase [Flavobacteriaceae bacterium]